MMRMLSLMETSNFLVCLIRHRAGAAYSAALYATAKVLMRSADVFAPHEVPAKHLIRLFLSETLERRPSKVLPISEFPIKFNSQICGMALVWQQ